ncbi:MAG: hypothetical protein WC673_00005 [Candidatus Paceibacterota bacterium]|jgi:hypothetical protein
MNADTSKFSLKQASEIIAPYLEHLSFKPLSFFTDQVFKDQICGLDFSFKLWCGHVLVSARLTPKDWVYAIPVERIVWVRRVEYRRLILERVRGDRDYGYWYFQQTDFFPSSKYSETHFYSARSTIVSIDDAGFEKFCPPDFPEKFWKFITEWAKESAEVRERALASLKALKEASVQEALKQRALASGLHLPSHLPPIETID